MLRNLHIEYFKGLTDVVLNDCGPITALFGKNNSGKSSVLHALDMAALALSQRNWNEFPLKMELADLFSDAGPFAVAIEYSDGHQLTVKARPDGIAPIVEPEASPEERYRFKSILILPDPEMGLLRRQTRTPITIMNFVAARRFDLVNGLDMLMALKYYGDRSLRGLTPDDYRGLIEEVRSLFPDLDGIESDRTEQDLATATYTEYGRTLDVLYTGTGLKHFLDMTVKIILSQARVVLIDEPEMGLHPDLQRKFVDFMNRLTDEKGLQFFLATHSPVFLSHEDVTVFRIANKKGHRKVARIEKDALHTVWADMGIRPSDLLQNDIVVMVEGQKDVIIFDHIINNLYQQELGGVSVGVIQYGGSSAEGIIGGHIDVRNITSAQGYVLWIRDRDAKPGDDPSTNATKFSNALKVARQECHILALREIEWYLPESVYVEAQQGDAQREEAVRRILRGGQEEKFTDAAEGKCTVPRGRYLRQILNTNLTRSNLHDELRELVERSLIPWRNEVLGVG